MKKKRIIILCVVAVCLIAFSVACILFFKPVPIISSPYTIGDVAGYAESEVVLSSIRFNGVTITDTDKVNTEMLIEILSNYRCRRGVGNPFPMPGADEVWQINLVYKFKPVHIVLGKNSVRYEDGRDQFMHRIIDPESLMSELSKVILD